MKNKQSASLKDIEVNKIRENPNNPRSVIDSVDDLKASIRNSGLLQPIAVRWKDGYYEVVAGSRRFRACKELRLETIPCKVLPQISDDMAYELATAENLVRENMTAVDEANAVAKLFAQGKSRTEIGAMFGKSARWAEGRRKIVELGDKAMKLLAEGKINFGHAEVLTMCNPEDVNKWLNNAVWQTPEALKNAIMNEKPLLERAPFDAKKVCKNCEKRSDEQKDLFGDVQCCYCLDRECFEGHVKKKADSIRKQYLKDGFEEVPEEDRLDAERGWNGYIDVESDDEIDKETIESLMKDGVKQKFWVNDKTAEYGFVYKEPDSDDDESDDNSEQNVTEDPNSWDYAIRHKEYDRICEVKRLASLSEKAILYTKMKETFGNIQRTAKAFILEILECTCENENGDCETYLKHPFDAEDKFLDEIADNICSNWNGVNSDIREYFGMDSREEFERAANDELGEDCKPEENKEEE